jgi:hypothetical protein
MDFDDDVCIYTAAIGIEGTLNSSSTTETKCNDNDRLLDSNVYSRERQRMIEWCWWFDIQRSSSRYTKLRSDVTSALLKNQLLLWTTTYDQWLQYFDRHSLGTVINRNLRVGNAFTSGGSVQNHLQCLHTCVNLVKLICSHHPRPVSSQRESESMLGGNLTELNLT